MVDLGYDSYNAIHNLGSISIVFTLYFIRVFILLWFMAITKCKEWKKGK